jgi:hypothetical protein
VYLKNLFCQINSNASNLHLGLLLTVTEWFTLSVWHIAMPVR